MLENFVICLSKVSRSLFGGFQYIVAGFEIHFGTCFSCNMGVFSPQRQLVFLVQKNTLFWFSSTFRGLRCILMTMGRECKTRPHLPNIGGGGVDGIGPKKKDTIVTKINAP